MTEIQRKQSLGWNSGPMSSIIYLLFTYIHFLMFRLKSRLDPTPFYRRIEVSIRWKYVRRDKTKRNDGRYINHYKPNNRRLKRKYQWRTRIDYVVGRIEDQSRNNLLTICTSRNLKWQLSAIVKSQIYYYPKEDRWNGLRDTFRIMNLLREDDSDEGTIVSCEPLFKHNHYELTGSSDHGRWRPPYSFKEGRVIPISVRLNSLRQI